VWCLGRITEHEKDARLLAKLFNEFDPVFSAWGANVPDIDREVPLFKHRGILHNPFFSILLMSINKDLGFGSLVHSLGDRFPIIMKLIRVILRE